MADTGLRKWAPGVATALGYRRIWLLPDLRAGAILTALLIPVGIGYAEVAGLPPESGLFATIVPLLVYAVVGPSRILVLAPDSALAPIIAAAILPLAAGDSARAVALAGLLGIMVGAVLILGGLLRLGFVTDLLSKPLRVGYLNALAVIVILSQIPPLLGFSLSSASPLRDAIAIVTGIVGGQVNPTAMLFGIGSLGVIVVLVWTKSRIPGILVAVVASMVLTFALGLHDGLPVVGALPAGLPAPALAGLQGADVVGLVLPALGMALIAFADTAVLSRTFAARRGDNVDGSQEMVAVGASNLLAGLFGGFPISASSSRTAAAESAGARSQLAGVAGAVLLVLFMLLAPGLTDFLPSATIAAVVMVAAAGLVDITGFVALVRMSRTDAFLSVAAFFGVLVVGVIEGIIVAVVLSLGEFVGHAWRPYRAELGRIHGLRGYHDLSRHPEGERLPGIVIVRFDAPLFFANGGIFDDYVRATVSAAGADVRTVILAAEPITDIDTTAVDELLELDEFLQKRGATLVFAEMKGPVKDVLRRYGLGKRFPPERFADTVGAAVDAATGTLRGDLDGTQWDRDA
ncbi:SulP family inorganic anion transporter [Cryobacterium sp. MDB1-18-2]|uniref:SulP family inorganic anion transporter n=2 Tax=Cryobacterium TaxID=69578 RepID=UPI00106C0087|nr:MULTISPECIES: SulP family inorganic anion transporter [unclassified Cryobacterium]MEB0201279.1 SulP family inorganic anion transporter [Cryobacterium sp. 5I3]MEB0286131.1 SulP family inorganic anion transporter [Cryobacterium sp. 10S3]TFC28004.1 SulP family inorganic anion transporter [Cryobacterium sp. MDB1-18-2]TFC40169.1 SulP family inorganic anion transporter [Cryobacterium sp. MDB1-18-1]WPX12189.1 SulP family inorganic anion transporter [Cryobacterium sp. 10S3]